MNNLFNKLNQIINEYDKFIIMGHKGPDLDSIGACLGLYKILEELNKKSYIFLDLKKESENNSTIISAINNIDQEINYITEKNYKNIINNKTLLIIVDVNQTDRVEFCELLNNIDCVVLDHHIKGHNYIKNTRFSYVDTNLSSVTELITNYANSLNISLGTTISTIMLAAIEIDTNRYNLRTTSNTYKSASILMTMGADTILKQEILKETIDDYLQRASIIKTSFMINEKMAMCIFTNKCTKERLAEVADELLKFVDIEVSFTIGKIDNDLIGVSSRSLGNYNVGKIMDQLGGGGNETIAAAQIKNSTIKQVKSDIIKIVG